MYFIYNILVPLIALIFSPVIALAFIIQPKFRAGFWKKIGFYFYPQDERETIIFHAVSVGETNAIEALIKKYRECNPDKRIVLTTTTKTGQEVAIKKLAETVDIVTYFPYDFVFSVNAFLNHFKPSKIVIAETEIWPCFLSSANKKGIKVYTVNGRISPRSYNGYKKFGVFFVPILDNYEKLLMQSKDDAKRIIDIGAYEPKVKVMGNLKYDITPNMTIQEVKSLWLDMGVEKSKVFIAASTHQGEDEIVLEAFTKAKSKIPELKFLIAPRHPQRFEKVESLLRASGFKYGKRSENANFIEKDIIMLDTMGELSKMFAICHVAFIGGSFSNTGGHNPLEANIWGKPVLSGPNIFNFKEVYNLVLDKKAGKIVKNSNDLLNELLLYIESAATYKVACTGAASIFEENNGAIDFVLNEI